MTNFFHQWRIGEKSYWYDISPLLHCFQSFGEFKTLMSTVQCPGSRVRRPEFSVRVLRPKSSVQFPASTVQRPPLALESRNSIMPFSSLIQSRRSRPEVFCKTGVLRSSTKFTGKHLCWSLFLIKRRLY